MFCVQALSCWCSTWGNTVYTPSPTFFLPSEQQLHPNVYTCSWGPSCPSSLTERVPVMQCQRGSGRPPLHSGLCTEPSANVTSSLHPPLRLPVFSPSWPQFLLHSDVSVFWRSFLTIAWFFLTSDFESESQSVSTPVWFHDSSKVCYCTYNVEVFRLIEVHGLNCVAPPLSLVWLKTQVCEIVR